MKDLSQPRGLRSLARDRASAAPGRLLFCLLHCRRFHHPCAGCRTTDLEKPDTEARPGRYSAEQRPRPYLRETVLQRGSRQHLHERIRSLSFKALQAVADCGAFSHNPYSQIALYRFVRFFVRGCGQPHFPRGALRLDFKPHSGKGGGRGEGEPQHCGKTTWLRSRLI